MAPSDVLGLHASPLVQVFRGVAVRGIEVQNQTRVPTFIGRVIHALLQQRSDVHIQADMGHLSGEIAGLRRKSRLAVSADSVPILKGQFLAATASALHEFHQNVQTAGRVVPVRGQEL